MPIKVKARYRYKGKIVSKERLKKLKEEEMKKKRK